MVYLKADRCVWALLFLALLSGCAANNQASAAASNTRVVVEPPPAPATAAPATTALGALSIGGGIFAFVGALLVISLVQIMFRRPI